MDLLFMGITDIIIVLILVAFLIIGAKKGISNKIVDLASTIVALIGSFLFTGQFRNMLIGNNIIYPNIYNNIMGNLQETDAFKDPHATLDTFLTELGLPEFLTKFIKDSTNIDAQTIANNIATALARIVMSVISFIVLFILILVLAKLAKLLIHFLREGSKLFKILDGILGFIVYGAFSVVLIYVLLFVLSLVMQIPALEPFRQFMIVDMELDTEKFRLSKYLYENNLVMNFFGLFL